MADNTSKKKIGKMQWAMLLRTMVPMLIMGLVIAGTAIKFNEKAVKSQVQDGLKMAASSIIEAYDQMYPGDYELKGSDLIALYKGDTDITSDYHFIDTMKKSIGVDASIVHGNTRILTTLVDEFGDRQIATGVNTAIVTAIDSKDSYYSYEGLIGQEKYFAYYAPLVNSDGSVIGLVGVAKQYDEIVTASRKAAIPVCAITLICMAIAAIISIRYTGELVGSINKIDRFLQNMIKGELSNEMPSSVLSRQDELGSTAKEILDMQSAIRVLVERDPLTSLYNRRYGGAKLRKLQKDAEKNGMPYAVALGDIDFFKKVNDTYGHEAGDIVLRKVSETLNKSMVGKGFVARWGGEEFLIIFSKLGGKEATIEMERILEKIRSMEIFYNNQVIKITMCFGVVDGAMSGDFAVLLREADSRLYYGKMNGRNRVVHNESMAMDAKKSDEAAAKESSASDSIKEAPGSREPDNKVKTDKNSDKNPEKNNEEIVIDDDFLQQIIDKMSEKLLKETTQD